jgi:hypothetical protein
MTEEESAIRTEVAMGLASEFFSKLSAGVPTPPHPIVSSPETIAWIRGISQPPLRDVSIETLVLTDDMAVREETPTPQGRTIRYSRWPGNVEES